MDIEFPRHPFTGLRAVGRIGDRWVWPVCGGAPDDPPGDPADPPDPDPADPPDLPEDYQAPSEDEWRQVQVSLAKANRQAAAFRGELAKIKKQHESDGDATKRVAEETATAAAEAKWKPMVVRNAASVALKDAGLIGKPDKLVRLIDAEKVEIDEDSGEVTGLQTQIDDLKKEYEALFRKNGSPGKVTGGEKPPVGTDEKQSTAQRLAARVGV